MRTGKLMAGALATALIVSACGGEDADTADAGDDPAAPTATEAAADDTGSEMDGGGEDDGSGGMSLDDVIPEDPSIADLQMTYESERTTQLMNLMAAKERTWNDVFSSVTLTATEEPIPALVSGAAWIVQSEPIALWPALEQGVVDGRLVGSFNDTDAWFFFTAEGIESPEDLDGIQFSGGPPGDSWNTVARIIMRDEFGIDPEVVEFVSVGGGSDGRAEAFLAGQIDGFMGQPRHIPLVEEAGGNMLFGEVVDMAQGMFLVETETMENNKDAVCAALGGLFEANQWIASGEEPDWSDRIPQVNEYLTENGYDPSESGLDVQRTWDQSQESEFNWALDLGAPADAWDRQLEILSRDGGEVSSEFDWRDYIDYSCVWELQEAAGLPLNPDPDNI